MASIRDFRVTNVGPNVVVLLLDGDGREIGRLTLSWITGLRLMNEAALAVSYGLIANGGVRGARI
jgi:hypothetical protein